MANSDKDIVITPNKGSTTADPKIVFTGNSGSVTGSLTLNVYPQNSGTLSFEGTSGQLFSIANTMSGTIFSANDVSGIPSIEVIDDGTVRLARFGGRVGVGVAVPSSSLHIQSTGTSDAVIRLSAVGNSAYFTDIVNSVDANRSFAISVSGTDAIKIAGPGGYSGLTVGSTTNMVIYPSVDRINFVSGRIGMGAVNFNPDYYPRLHLSGGLLIERSVLPNSGLRRTVDITSDSSEGYVVYSATNQSYHYFAGASLISYDGIGSLGGFPLSGALYNPWSSNLQIRGGTAGIVEIPSYNILGIGTPNPTSIVHIVGPGTPAFDDGANVLRLDTPYGFEQYNTGSGLVFAQRYNSITSARVAGIYGFKAEGAYNGTYGGGLHIFTQPVTSNSGTLMQPRMTIRSDGNVGIGNINPTTLLTVNGNVSGARGDFSSLYINGVTVSTSGGGGGGTTTLNRILSGNFTASMKTSGTLPSYYGQITPSQQIVYEIVSGSTVLHRVYDNGTFSYYRTDLSRFITSNGDEATTTNGKISVCDYGSPGFRVTVSETNLTFGDMTGSNGAVISRIGDLTTEGGYGLSFNSSYNSGMTTSPAFSFYASDILVNDLCRVGYGPGNVTSSVAIGNAVATTWGASNAGNVAIGYYALNQGAAAGTSNVVIGSMAGYAAIGNNNVIVGAAAGTAPSGDGNVIVGQSAGGGTPGAQNVFVGQSAGQYLGYSTGDIASESVIIGCEASTIDPTGTLITRCYRNTIVGGGARPINDSQNEIILGWGAYGHGSNTITLGNESITDVYVNGTDLWLTQSINFKSVNSSASIAPHSIGIGTLYARNKTGRPALEWQPPAGADYSFQPHLGMNSVASLRFIGLGTTTNTRFNLDAPGTTGTAGAPPVGTSFSASLRRVDYSAGGSAGATAGVYGNTAGWWRGNSAGLGGVYFVSRFVWPKGVYGGRMFCGLSTGTTNPTNFNPSAFFNIVGVGKDAGDANYQFMHNDGTGTATKTSTGIAAANNDTLEVRIFMKPNGTSSIAYMTLEKLGGAVSVADYDSAASTDFPSNTTFLNYYLYAQCTGTNSPTIAPISIYLESDY